MYVDIVHAVLSRAVINTSFLQPSDSFDGDTVDLVCTTNGSGSCARFLASQEVANITDAFVSCS